MNGGGLSGGGVFLIIIFVSFMLYVIGGCVFLRHRGATGMKESCLGYEQWSNFGGLVRDGCLFSKGFVMSKISGEKGEALAGGTASYDTL